MQIILLILITQLVNVFAYLIAILNRILMYHFATVEVTFAVGVLRKGPFAEVTFELWICVAFVLLVTCQAALVLVKFSAHSARILVVLCRMLTSPFYLTRGST